MSVQPRWVLARRQLARKQQNEKAPRPVDVASTPEGNCCPKPTIGCSHPKESLVMRGWTQVCTLCGLGRQIG